MTATSSTRAGTRADRWLTVSELSLLSGWSAAAIRRQCRVGTLPFRYRRVGRRWAIGRASYFGMLALRNAHHQADRVTVA